MFFLIKLLLLPVWLPFKILIELAEHSGRRSRYRRRRGRAQAARRVRTTRARSASSPSVRRPSTVWTRPATSSRPPRPRAARAAWSAPAGSFTTAPGYPAGHSHWQSLSRGRQVVLLAMGSVGALIVAGCTAGLAASVGSAPAHQGRAQAVVHASAPAAARIASPPAAIATPVRSSTPVRHRRHHHRRHHHRVIVPPTPAPAPATSAAPAPAGCYPKASSGNCYEPGEYCPYADAGQTGVAGDGEKIICENNNGLRWEPA